MWLVELIRLILANRESSKRIAELESDEFDTMPATAKPQILIGETGLYFIMDTQTGIPVGNAMNAFTATYTLDQLGDNNRYEIREYSL